MKSVKIVMPVYPFRSLLTTTALFAQMSVLKQIKHDCGFAALLSSFVTSDKNFPFRQGSIRKTALCVN